MFGRRCSCGKLELFPKLRDRLSLNLAFGASNASFGRSGDVMEVAVVVHVLSVEVIDIEAKRRDRLSRGAPEPILGPPNLHNLHNSEPVPH